MEHSVTSNSNVQRSTIVRPEVPNRFEIKPQILYQYQVELLRKCPNHRIPKWMQMEIFYNGITVSTRSLIDAAAGGPMNKKTPNEVYELIEEMTSNMYQYPVERSARGRKSVVHNVDHVLALQAQVESLTKQLTKLHTSSLVAQICDMCGGGHPNHECQAGNIQAVSSFNQANYVSNFHRSNDPYSNTYNPGWGSHPNFSWSNNNQQSSTQQPNAQARPPPGFQRATQEQEQKASLEDIFSKFLANQEKRYAWTKARFQTQEASLKNQEASIQNLEIQVGQLANVISGRNQGTLPTNFETNPKEQIKAITLRSRKVLEEQKQPQVEEDKANQQQDKEREEQNEGREQEIMMNDNLKRCLAQSCIKEDDDPLMQQRVEQLEAEGNKEEEEGAEIKDQSKLELKPLPSSLKYVYLEDSSKPVIISSCLNAREEQLLIEVLSKHKKAIGRTISDIKGISPTTCMHKILKEDSFKPTIQPQRMLNPTLQEVVKKEVVKLLDTSIIYPISDSKWVSPVQGVPKKDLVLTRCEDSNLVLNWEKCHFMVNEGIVLGHKISERGIEVDRAKIEAGEKRLLDWSELEELRYWAYDNARLYKLKTKRRHDKNIRMKNFEVGQKVLLYNSRLKFFPEKLMSRWQGPYEVVGVSNFGEVKIQHPKNGEKLKVNGHRLKLYQERFPAEASIVHLIN
ncbi:hypothetical protein H6P81_002861 [Aristolochia fimbriata]|uniref:Uncharacterized protein n=1 Tax=Aristolochia fimbriata TaxID=158543 RepID=A0AAV7FBN4_ARIFI|nr:hypothetical protein H6P81_002861 [Aristolochia fimbriata]